MRWSEYLKRNRSIILNHKSNVDTDQVWNNIESDLIALNNKKKRRNGVVWFFFGLFIVSGFTYSGLRLLNSEDTLHRIEMPLNSELTQSKTEIDVFESNVDQKVRTESTNSNSHSNTIRSVVPVSVDNSREMIYSDEKILDVGTELVDVENEREETNQKDSEGNSTITVEHNSESLEDRQPIKDNSELNVESEKIVNDITPNRLSNLSNSIYFLNYLDLQYLNYNDKSLILPTKKFSVHSKKDNDAFKLGLNIYGGIGFSPRDMVTESPFLDSMIEVRNATEKSLETGITGVSLIVQHNSGLAIKLGVQQTQIVEQFRFKDDIVKYETVNGIQYYSVNVFGDTVAIEGPVQIKKVSSVNKEYFNRYKLIELPVILSYQLDFNRFYGTVNLGVISNLSLKTSGQIIDFRNNDSFIDIDKDQDTYFKSSLGFGFTMSLGAGYKISDRLYIELSPTYRTYSEQFTQNAYGIEQSYSTVSANLGLIYWMR